jgi:type III restriction enzyme
LKVIEDAARTLLQTWKQQHLASLAHKGGQAQQDFLSVFTESSVSEEITIQRPKPTSVADRDEHWPMHLLAAEPGQTVPAGRFPFAPASSWEARVLTTELERDDVVGWYRNPTGGPHAIAVPWGEPGSQRMLYPDFVIFTDRDGEVSVSLIDPHQPNQGDTIQKWLALGEYAEKNTSRLDRVWAVIDEKGSDDLLFLDLKTQTARDALAQAAAGSGEPEQRVRAAFAAAGGRFK